MTARMIAHDQDDATISPLDDVLRTNVGLVYNTALQHADNEWVQEMTVRVRDSAWLAGAATAAAAAWRCGT